MKIMEPFMNWRDEDNKFLDIDVLNPRTHIKDGKAVYTDYEIHVKTNHPEFAIKELHIRRRYSEFVWLKNKLGVNDIMMTTPPSLPGKRLIGRFKDTFLRKRQMGLQHFMNKVVEINAFLSYPALHLFLQTDLPIEQMENYLRHGGLLSNVRDKVVIFQKLREQEAKKKEVAENKLSNVKTTESRKTQSLDQLDRLQENITFKEGENGRGWSQYIGGAGYCSWPMATDRDVTDYGSRDMLQHRNFKTAYVLPGGQLFVPDDSMTTSDTNELPTNRQRSQSWHGNTSDFIDLFLDSYDVISPPAKDLYSDVESMTYSQSTGQCSNSGTWLDGSSDGSMTDIDMNEKLAEYFVVNTVPSEPQATKYEKNKKPLKKVTSITSSDNLFHHSLSASYDDYQS